MIMIIILILRIGKNDAWMICYESDGVNSNVI